ncbi:kinase-like domain-containing protein [Ilyonectria destructans]|nr:kinase-like domain-containing protein [Ilyonectria destructans]
MSFSNSSGGTLALPSPTHAHQIDVTSAVRTLRRSMSRSPSKFITRTNSQSSESLEGSHHTSPQSPCRRFGSTPQHQQPLPSNTRSAPPFGSSNHATVPHQSIFGTPFRPSVRLSLRSAKKSSPSRPLTRARASPKSPLKRALINAPDNGNSLPSTTPSSTPGSPGQENFTLAASSPARRKSCDMRHSVHLDVSGSSQSAFNTLDTNTNTNANNNSDNYMVSNTGSLKRSDATMNLDQPSQGSPVAKRRSLHGITGLVQNEDQNIFGSNTTSSQSFSIHEDSGSEYELSGAGGAPLRDPLPSPTPTANVPKRSSSLRKSTLQQRYGERGSLGRRTGERQLAQISADFSPVRSRPRLSMDQFVPPHVRDSPFSTSTTPPSNPPSYLMDNKAHQPHPLSKTLSTSSSGGSITEEAPFFAPAPRVSDRPRPHPFSKSLPLNATRPTRSNDPMRSMATPNKSQLWVGAFSSTGLISKVNRNPEEEADRKMAPPDTPCKKHSNPFATFPPPAGSAMKKRGNNRNSFAGLPSTPFNPISGQAPNTFGNPGKGLAIFQRGNSRSSRRGSVLSLDGEEPRLFGECIDLSNSLEGDAPPTPTKNSMTPSLSNLSNVSEHSLESPSANRTLPPTSAVRPIISRESTSSPVDGRRTPQTPQESLLPLDTSRLSISQAGDGYSDNMPPPVTPTAGRDFRSSTSLLVTPVNIRTNNVDVDTSLYSRFDKVDQIGKGEFSTVYRVTKVDHRQMAFDALISTTPSERSRSPAKGEVFAVKKSKQPYQGPKDRETKLREAQILKALCHADHVVKYIDEWEHNLHLYIQTEFCEEGTLDKFLGNVGRGGRLDDFRIFKVLHDLSLGLKEIHEAGFMHLDLKPANILVTFEGTLKIGDFGLAQACTSAHGVDVEGDREYMAPEMLKGKVGQSADVFSLGLIILETAANVVLPDNGPTWIALRSGDLSEVPSLTWTPSIEVQRDAAGNPTESVHSDEFSSGKTHDPSNLFGSYKRSEMEHPPDFMVNAFDPSSLDSVVRWMTAQEPGDRSSVQQVLELEGLRWVADHRAAPATVYEGSWGPAELFPVSIAGDSDTEMTDV